LVQILGLMGMYFDAVAVLVEVILYLVLHDLIILISHEFAYFMNEGLYLPRYLNILLSIIEM
jgi:hypothetical protein